MIKEYNINSIMIPEGYVIITMEETEFIRIITENFNKKNKAIVYIWNNTKYMIDAKAHILLQTALPKKSLH